MKVRHENEKSEENKNDKTKKKNQKYGKKRKKKYEIHGKINTPKTTKRSPLFEKFSYN